MALELLTGCYSHYRPRHGIGVRASLGRPSWFSNEGRDLPVLKAATPAPWFWQTDDDAEFDREYAAQLARWGIDRMRADLEAIAVRFDCPRLVVLCFEGDPAKCHRSAWARWWETETGQHVPDLSDLPRAER